MYKRDRRKEFFKEYENLCKKYGIYIYSLSEYNDIRLGDVYSHNKYNRNDEITLEKLLDELEYQAESFSRSWDCKEGYAMHLMLKIHLGEEEYEWEKYKGIYNYILVRTYDDIENGFSINGLRHKCYMPLNSKYNTWYKLINFKTELLPLPFLIHIGYVDDVYYDDMNYKEIVVEEFEDKEISRYGNKIKKYKWICFW